MCLGRTDKSEDVVLSGQEMSRVGNGCAVYNEEISCFCLTKNEIKWASVPGCHNISKWRSGSWQHHL